MSVPYILQRGLLLVFLLTQLLFSMNIDSSPSRPTLVAPSGHAKRAPHMIVLCFDGTGNEYGDTNTNVVKLYSLLRKDTDEQVCYYQPGIGTYTNPAIVGRVYRSASRVADQAVAWYLSEHVKGGYKFLMQNYDYGDEVCIFGFSRGAYTARALAGMLHKVGLLPKDNIEQVTFAYKLYKSSGEKNEKIAKGFKTTFCRAVPITFVGVWDTVSSVGLLTTQSLPFVEANTNIGVFRQALALDEHRAKFRPNHRSRHHRPSTKGDQDDKQRWTDKLFDTDVKEVWFAGCHSDVGGGTSPDSEGHTLSNISLRWMLKEIVSTHCHILFTDDARKRWIPRILVEESLSPSSGEGTPTNEEGPDTVAQDAQDAVQKITDELKKNPLWWILEMIPTPYTYQNAKQKWVTTWFSHWGRGRVIPSGALFHTSVKTRIDDEALNYKPRARHDPATVRYVS